MLFDGIRADIVLEVMTLFHHIVGVKMKVRFLAAAIKVMEHTQLFRSIQRNAFGSQSREMGGQVRAHTGKVRSRFFHILFVDGDRDIFFLHDAVSASGFLQQHFVIFAPKLIQTIILHREQDGLLKGFAVHAAVIDRDFGRSAAIQTVQQFRVGQKHGFLVLAGGNKIVDVGELKGLGKLVTNHKNTVLPNAADGNHILYLSGNRVSLFILLKELSYRFYHFSLCLLFVFFDAAFQRFIVQIGRFKADFSRLNQLRTQPCPQKLLCGHAVIGDKAHSCERSRAQNTHPGHSFRSYIGFHQKVQQNGNTNGQQ